MANSKLSHSTGLSLLIAAIFNFIPLMNPISAQAVPAPGDYDGDGFSDLVTAKVVRGKIPYTRFQVRRAVGTIQSFQFKKPGDALGVGSFFGESHQNPAIVYVQDANLPLRWYTRRDDNTKPLTFFGDPGDTPVPADYDCDGATDFAVKTEDSASKWKFRLSSGLTVSPIAFGSKGTRVFGADIDGDGCAEMFDVRLSGGIVKWRFRKLLDSTVTEKDWGVSGDLPMRPMDVNNDGTPDLIIVRRESGRHVAHIRTSLASTSDTTKDIGPSGTIPLTGNFTGVRGFAYFDRSTGLHTIINPDNSLGVLPIFGYKTGAVVRPDGSVVQNGEDERLGSASSGGGGGGGGDDDTPPGGSSYTCDHSIDTSDGGGGFTHNPQNSRNTIKLMLPGSYTDNVSSVYAGKNGSLIEQLYRVTPNEYGNRERRYGRNTPGSYPKNMQYVVFLKNGRVDCATIKDPVQRVD